MNIDYLTFANTGWSTQCLVRQRNSIESIQQIKNVFRDVFILNEKDLDKEYFDIFGKYLSDRGYGYWSWKVYLIYKHLNRLNDGDVLLYLDAGCVFPDDKLNDFIESFEKKIHQMFSNKCYIGLTDCYLPTALICNQLLLKHFDLNENQHFLFKYPHYQAGLQIIIKNDQTMNIYKQWYDLFINHYEDILHKPFWDKTGERPEYIHNGADQGALQCILYKNKFRICKCNDLFNYYDFVKRSKT